jgi:hypothetical protein
MWIPRKITSSPETLMTGRAGFRAGNSYESIASPMEENEKRGRWVHGTKDGDLTLDTHMVVGEKISLENTCNPDIGRYQHQ